MLVCEVDGCVDRDYGDGFDALVDHRDDGLRRCGEGEEENEETYLLLDLRGRRFDLLPIHLCDLTPVYLKTSIYEKVWTLEDCSNKTSWNIVRCDGG